MIHLNSLFLNINILGADTTSKFHTEIVLGIKENNDLLVLAKGCVQEKVDERNEDCILSGL